MAESHIQARLRDFLASRRAGGSTWLSLDDLTPLAAAVPHLTPAQIRSLCKSQEQTIVEKILPLRNYDLYAEISRVCPSESDLRCLSGDELATRISLCSSKLVLTERVTCESEEEWSQGEGEGEEFFSDVGFGHCLLEDLPQKGMRFILEECEEQHCWGSEYFGMT